MPKNAGGKKFKKIKHHFQTTRALVLPEKDQYYALVNKLLGNCTVTVTYVDPQKGNTEILSKIRHTLKRKKQWVKVGNYVLISLRDFEEGKADVIHVYNEQEINDLKRKGHIGSELVPQDKKAQYEDMEFADLIDEEEEIGKKPKVRGLGRNNLVKDNYGIISSDEEDSEEEDKE